MGEIMADLVPDDSLSWAVHFSSFADIQGRPKSCAILDGSCGQEMIKTVHERMN